jgi:hypothetical protein
MLKQFVFVCSFLLLLTSCGGNSSEKNASDSTAAVVDSTTKNAKDTANNSPFKTIIATLPEQMTTINYNEDYLSDDAALEKYQSSVKPVPCAQAMLPDSISCADSVYFGWKISYEKFTLVSCMTSDWNAKGSSAMYHLLTIDNSNGAIIDCRPEYAGAYAVAVENPNGGTSAGIQYTTASLQVKPSFSVATVDRESDSDTATVYELNPDGHFVMTGLK